MSLVLLNARAACRPELGGVERWARELLPRLCELEPERYAVARPPQALVHRAGHLWEQVVLPARAARLRAGLLLSPANLAPLAWPRNVVVIHDAAALREPSWYSREYAAWQRVMLPQIARRARHVVTVSEFSRAEIVELLGVAAERVTVIAGGVSERFTPGAAEAGGTRPSPYVLAVASATARKNLRALEEPARVLAAQGVELVVAGGTRPQFRGGGGGEATALTQLGHVDDALLPGLYAGAQAFVLPSLHEGFGLTCLEAMACGTPVVAAARGGLPEACGDAALLVDPEDPGAIAQALQQAIARRGELRDRGLRRAAQFTWERTAGAVHALLATLEP
jgi:glycosyltransferase involved in cell wall biosynthesis